VSRQTLSAVPATAGSDDLQQARRNRSATANPQIAGKGAEKHAAEISAQGKLRALGMRESHRLMQD